MNKPDWKDAPSWANWLSMDEGGIWHWFEEKPYIDGYGWSNVDVTEWEEALKTSVYEINWQSSLEKRPMVFYPGGGLIIPDNPTPPYYNFEYKGIKLDPYRIAEVYEITSHPQFHALKKILRAHIPNHKTLEQNIDEAVSALQRWKEIINE